MKKIVSMTAPITPLFNRYLPKIKEKLLALCQFTFDVAVETKGVGALEETVR